MKKDGKIIIGRLNGELYNCVQERIGSMELYKTYFHTRLPTVIAINGIIFREVHDKHNLS